MNARVVVTAILLLSFPASILAQAPSAHLDLTPLKRLSLEPPPTPRPLPILRVHNEFAQSGAPIKSCAESQTLGRADGHKQSLITGWFFGGLGAGFATNIYSFAYMPAVAHHIKPMPRDIPDGVDVRCYLAGYVEKARVKNAWGATLGSAVGTVFSFLVFSQLAE